MMTGVTIDRTIRTFVRFLKWIFEVYQRIQMLKKDLQILFTQFYAKACQECKESDVMEKRVQRI